LQKKFSIFLNKTKPKKIFINYSLGKEPFLCAAANQKKDMKIYGYALHGITLSNQSLTSHLLFNNIDHLFLYGTADFLHFENLKKLNTMHNLSLPKSFSVIGSVRDWKYYKTSMIKESKKKNNLKKFLYIKSNQTMLNDIDGFYLQMFFKIISKYFKNKFSITLKERDGLSDVSKILLKDKLLKEDQIITNPNVKTEELICSHDYIFGTYSTSLIYQSIFFKKPLIQLGSKKIFWGNLSKLNFLYADNEDDLNRIIELIKDDKVDVKKIIEKQNECRKMLFPENSVNPTQKILEQLI